MRSLPALPRPRVLALIALATAATLAACGDVTAPSDAVAKRASLAPKTAAHDDTPTDTTANRPTIPWY